MNTEKHIRLAALDLDGTTLRSDKSLSEYTIETLKNAHEHGMHIVVASGRSFCVITGTGDPVSMGRICHHLQWCGSL